MMATLTFNELRLPREFDLSKNVFSTLSHIYDGAFCENSENVLGINYFRQKLSHRCLLGPLDYDIVKV